jgi:hypothetical protein
LDTIANPDKRRAIFSNGFAMYLSIRAALVPALVAAVSATPARSALASISRAARTAPEVAIPHDTAVVSEDVTFLRKSMMILKKQTHSSYIHKNIRHKFLNFV